MRVFAPTGYDLEIAFAGISSRDVHPRFRNQRVRTFREGLDLVRGWQRELGNWNPRRPRTDLAYGLYRRVASRLPGAARDLRLYIAFGTMVDRMGVDCFFEHNTRVVTIDITICTLDQPWKRKKSLGPNTDLVITLDDFVRDRHYQIGDVIARRLSSPWS